MKYAFSEDEERYNGDCDTANEAVYEGFQYHGLEEGETLWVGEVVSPPAPEDRFESEDWLEQVSVQDEYSGDWAEGWDGSSKEQRAELTEAVRKVMAEWLDRYGLRPKFFNIESPVAYTIHEGVVVRR